MGLFNKNKSNSNIRNSNNWKALGNQTYQQKPKYRDVYENQTIERTDRKQVGSKNMRMSGAVVLGLIALFGIFFAITFIQYGKGLWVRSMEVEGASFFDGVLKFGDFYWVSIWSKLLFSSLAGLGVFGIAHDTLMRDYKVQNILTNHSDINQHIEDQHIALPEEVMHTFDFFADCGAHCPASPNSLISHVMLTNKGLQKIQTYDTYTKNEYDTNGDLLHYDGEIKLDKNGNKISTMVPFIDEVFSEQLFDSAEVPKELRRKFNATDIDYNKGNRDREKVKNVDTLADLINTKWTFPSYELQRPGGAYIVDTSSVNTMYIGMTRAGKGQTQLEALIDMWSRELNPNNFLANDPKGELLFKNYVRLVRRGFEVVRFDLMNVMKTSIYNPLTLASVAAVEGDFTKCASYVEGMGSVFFPNTGGDDPVWSNSANNAFKRCVYGLIDYYLEEEKELRNYARETGMDPVTLNTKLDRMWGQVTLYNCYQLFVQYCSKKIKNPHSVWKEQGKMLEDETDIAIHMQKEEEVLRQAEFWDGKPELDMMSLFFNFSEKLPKNSMRTLVSNANNSLKSIGGADKMLASIYGITVTEMAFFTDPTIASLTSGTPSQSADLGGYSFPRRLGVRFHVDILEKYHLVGLNCIWSAYEDVNFTKNLGKDFDHLDVVGRDGWARYYFKGIFPKDTAYIKLELKNPVTNIVTKTFFFKFVKNYQTSLDGRYYIYEQITGEKIIKNGILTELVKTKVINKKTKEERLVMKEKSNVFMKEKISNLKDIGKVMDDGKVEAEFIETNVPYIVQTSVNYSEKCKATFVVTPPHLKKYAKLILLLIKQLVDLNFDKSYLTKASQKPLYKTRYLLDELGNLESNGVGIDSFQTLLSIGLGQEQIFLLVLQTLQQLRDVYGESADKIIQGNVSNIVFLKSTDDAMLDTLSKMSGTTHKTYTDSKNVTQDLKKIYGKTEGTLTYSSTTIEKPVISYNDLAFIPLRNSIVFRAGDSPIWNRNEMAFPMSYMLFKRTVSNLGHEFTPLTLPSTSTVKDFDLRKNQPDFIKMFEKRLQQASLVDECKEIYVKAYNYSEHDVMMLDPDVLSDELMDLIRDMMIEEISEEDEMDEKYMAQFSSTMDDFEVSENTDFIKSMSEMQAKKEALKSRVYIEGVMDASDLVNEAGHCVGNTSYQTEFAIAYTETINHFRNDKRFIVTANGELLTLDNVPLIVLNKEMSDHVKILQANVEDEESMVYAENKEDIAEIAKQSKYKVLPRFVEYMTQFSDWKTIADGAFLRELSKQFDR